MRCGSLTSLATTAMALGQVRAAQGRDVGLPDGESLVDYRDRAMDLLGYARVYDMRPEIVQADTHELFRFVAPQGIELGFDIRCFIESGA